VWADNAADLYEAAIREQWKPATEISWGSIEALPEHVEAALDEIFSNISEQQYNSMQVMGGWFKEISYGYHEVKLYLSTQVFDRPGTSEAFRKRAEQRRRTRVQSPCFFDRAVYASFKFTEYTIYVNIIAHRSCSRSATSPTNSLAGGPPALREHGERPAPSSSYGIAHVKHYVQAEPSKRHNINLWLRPRRDDGRRHEARRRTARGVDPCARRHDRRRQGPLRELRKAQQEKYLLTLEAATFVTAAKICSARSARRSRARSGCVIG
jgi:hypothetical protein